MITFRSDAPVSATLEANTNTLSLATRSSTLTLPAVRDGDNLTGLIADIQRLNLSGTLNTASFDTNQLTAHTEVSVRKLYTNLTDINLWSMQTDPSMPVRGSAG